MSGLKKIFVFSRWLQIKSTSFLSWTFGVQNDRKRDLFIDLSRSATLGDAVYWLQIILAAGIATLGLVLSSPAVIIGAMLISPLMNPILAAGLALASGDLVLGLRAAANLILSCIAAVAFAVLLVTILPFREMTPEIIARTQPNVLDLLIALFSGAIGSVAICRELKGVVTSIPGVAIAVALMPPLCVVGYGIGLIVVLDQNKGWQVASGGGLLFLTNLVAITLTAMLVFMALRIQTAEILKKHEKWKQSDPESLFVINKLKFFPGLARAQKIHSLSLRLGMILLPLILILFPLGKAFNQLKEEIIRKQRESQIRQAVTDVWVTNFQNKQDGKTRSSIDQLSVSEIDGKWQISLRVFDDIPYSVAEKKECAQKIAEKLKIPTEKINLKLTEIPTVLGLSSIERAREEKTASPLKPPTLDMLNQELTERVDLALTDFNLESPVKFIKNEIITGSNTPLTVNINYLSDIAIEAEARDKISNELRSKLKMDNIKVVLERVPVTIGKIEFNQDQKSLTILGMMQLDFAGRILRDNAHLNLNVTDQPINTRTATAVGDRLKTINEYLETRWQISPNRIQMTEPNQATETTTAIFEFDGNRNNEV